MLSSNASNRAVRIHLSQSERQGRWSSNQRIFSAIKVPPELPAVLASSSVVEQFLDDPAAPSDSIDPTVPATVSYGMKFQVPLVDPESKAKLIDALQARLEKEKKCKVVAVFGQQCAEHLTLLFVREVAAIAKNPVSRHSDYCSSLLRTAFGTRQGSALWDRSALNGNTVIKGEIMDKFIAEGTVVWTKQTHVPKIVLPDVSTNVGVVAVAAGTDDATQLYFPDSCVAGNTEDAGATVSDAESFPGMPGRPCKHGRFLEISPDSASQCSPGF